MAKYRKKTIIIEAEVYKPGMEDGFTHWGSGLISIKNGVTTVNMGRRSPYINTLEGKLRISEGDYIITGVKGERYPCKPDVFEMTYEKVE